MTELEKALAKTEIDYISKNGGGRFDELAYFPFNYNTESVIKKYLKSLGYKYKCTSNGVVDKWLEFTNGLLVYLSDGYFVNSKQNKLY